MTAGEVATSGLFNSFTFNAGNTSDRNGLLATINGSSAADKAYLIGILDTNHNGTIDVCTVLSATCTAAMDELRSYTFKSTTGNPNGAINYRRIIETAVGPQETKTEGQTVYLQDTLQFGRFAVNAAVRAEKWEHIATQAETSSTFDWEYAPRLSVG